MYGKSVIGRTGDLEVVLRIPADFIEVKASIERAYQEN